MVYGKIDTDWSFIWVVMYHSYIHLCIKRNGGSGYFVLTFSSVSDRSSKMLKMPKQNHIKIFIFRKHFSNRLKDVCGLICFSLCILIYFTFFVLFLAKKLFQKFFFSIYIFTISDTLFHPIWHKPY